MLQAIHTDLRETKEVHAFKDSGSSYTKTLGSEWNATTDSFRVTIAEFPLEPETLQETWRQWRRELHCLMGKDIPRCYFPKHVTITSFQLHGFSDASEDAYAGVVYFRMVDLAGGVHTSLIMSKTKVSPIKRLSIPRLELCGAVIVTKLLWHIKVVFQVPTSDTFIWTDSSIVLYWLSGNIRRFKTFVGNRVSEIVDRLPPEQWNQVKSADNPADCASRGILPSELLDHHLWWKGPPWLSLTPSCWPTRPCDISEDCPDELRDVWL